MAPFRRALFLAAVAGPGTAWAGDAPFTILPKLLVLASAVRLLAAVACLFSVGFLLTRLMPRLWFASEPGVFSAHRIFVGQLFLMLWVYLRSMGNHIAGAILPIGWADWLGLLLLLAALVHRREGLRRTWCALTANRAELTLAFAVVGLLLLVICRDEVPRLAMLSSDPDQHAFWARQIERFGTLPFSSQFYWGPRDFDYPGGFAVLNFTWSSLSGLDVRDVVAVQGLVQTQLAMLALTEILAPPMAGGREGIAQRLAAVFMLFLTYYRLLPYGYQLPLYHLEGAGRTGSLLFLGVGLCFAVAVLRRLGDREFATRIDPFANALFAGMVLAGAALINVVNLPCFALPFVAGGALLVVQRPSIRRAAVALGFVPVLGLVFLDPYYLKRLFRPGEVYFKAAGPSTAGPPRMAASYLSGLGRVLGHPGDAAADAFRTDLLAGKATVVLLAALAAGVLVLLLARAVAPRDAAALGMVAALALLAHLFLSPLGEALRLRGPDSYLVATYLEASRRQLVVLWFYACLALIYIGMARLPVGVLAAGGACVVLILAAVHNDEAGPLRRKFHDGSLGGVAADDLAVIGGIEERFRAYRRSEGPLAFERIPKILILNELRLVNGENWLFPHGASRILPLYDVFPVAFFYFQGSNDYFYRSYVEHVCERFDEDWLAQRGIRYLFLPSDRGTPCVSELDRVLERSRILLRQGQSLFVELPGPR